MKIFPICLTFGVFILGVTGFAEVQNRKPLPPMNNLRLVVKKKKRLLEIYDGEKFIRRYRMVLGFAATGDKEIEGDGKTPEGDFYVFTKNDQSKFYLSVGLSYPNAEAAQRGWREGVISREKYDEILEAVAEKRMPPQKTRLGGEIYIHGGGTKNDWTEGCVALENAEMKEIFDAISVGTNVRILP